VRVARAALLAIVLLAVMPAFALLRYEHTRAVRAGVSSDAASQSAMTPKDSEQAGPPMGSGAHAASSATVFQRAIALEAVRAIEDSIPRAPGSAAPEWRGPSTGRDVDGVSWPVVVSSRLRSCADDARPYGPCRNTRNGMAIVFVRMLEQDFQRADVLARWFVAPDGGDGYFRVVLERKDGAWVAARVVRSEAPEQPLN